MGKITGRQIWKTLHADLIGKDSQRGITLTYGWFANQLGHFALGFVPTSIAYILGVELKTALFSVACFWLAFEIYNASSPLYKKEYKGNGTFKPQWKNLTFDTFTDLCFFWTGSLTFYFIASTDKNGLYFFLAGLLPLFFFGRYWFLTKLYQQNAFFPYAFRLSQWNGRLKTEDADFIRHYLRQRPREAHHFIVSGAKKSGKTTITVGMANELAIRHNKTTYTTLSKWVSVLSDSQEELSRGNKSLWTWQESEFLLIDDINPGTPEEANKYKATDIESFINNSGYGDTIKQILGNTSVAWVVGSCSNDDGIRDWKEMLIRIGIPKDKVTTIDLNSFQSGK